MPEPLDKYDACYVVVKNGVRQSGLLTAEEAEAKADETAHRLTESEVKDGVTVEVKQHIVE